MIWFAVSALVFWTICGVLSKLTREDRAYIDTSAFVIAGFVSLFIGFSILVGGASVAAEGMGPMGAGLLVVAFVPGLVLLIPWVWHVLGLAAHEAGQAALGVESMTVRRTYDAAEKLMHERKFEEAERAFLSEAEKEPEDPQPLRRAGDAALAAGRAEIAVGHFRRTLSRIRSDEDRASLGIRIAEIEHRTLGNEAAARRTLEDLLAELGHGAWGTYVRERLKRLG
jgi:hypothetical protein